MQVGYCNSTLQEIELQDGERLVGVKSRIYRNNDPSYSAWHCNMVFVFGKLE